jgi:hypothetical protein
LGPRDQRFRLRPGWRRNGGTGERVRWF